jgi:integrase
MGRTANAPKREWTGKFWRLRFTHDGVRHDFKNMTIPKSAVAQASRWESERLEFVYSGKWKDEQTEGKDPAFSFKKAFALYIAEKRGGEITEETADKYQEYFKKRFASRWRKLSDITKGSLASYQSERLKDVQYTTVKKELSPIRQVLKYAEDHEWIAQVPRFPKKPAKSKGTKHKHAPSGYTSGFTAAMAQATIAKLPEWTKADRGTKTRWPLRAHFEFQYETGLRPGLLVGIRYGVHWRKGQTFLRVTADIDKNRWERDLPLTTRALEILESIDAKPDGRMFAKRDYRVALRNAAAAGGVPSHIAERVHAYDMRHARTTEWVNESNQPLGVAFLVGHKQMTTTNRYSHADEKQAAEVLRTTTKKPLEES